MQQQERGPNLFSEDQQQQHLIPPANEGVPVMIMNI